ncbi:uncharacterized protein LOC131860199 [Cryptomeria japonica]|uniref:uncharacterized protein LOC131860199 n=1 Tax=Cryptomeria japonica TaxID=3369 RepID=UPI0027DA0762|nr:uncharacterized protein LOC131860199 [Cryptomeria japonica]
MEVRIPSQTYKGKQPPQRKEEGKIQESSQEQTSGPTSKRSVNGFQRVNPSQQVVDKTIWKSSNQGWIKVNFDGVAHGNPSPSSAGCTARDFHGHKIANWSQNIGMGSNNETKVKATLLVVRLARRLEVEILQLEGDSQIIIHAILKGEVDNWKLN